MNDLRTFSLFMKIMIFKKGITSSLISTVNASLMIKLQQSKFILNTVEKGKKQSDFNSPDHWSYLWTNCSNQTVPITC